MFFKFRRENTKKKWLCQLEADHSLIFYQSVFSTIRCQALRRRHPALKRKTKPESGRSLMGGKEPAEAGGEGEMMPRCDGAGFQGEAAEGQV